MDEVYEIFIIFSKLFVLRCVSKKKKIREREKSCQSPHRGRGNGTAEQSMETETTAAVVYNRKKIRDIGSISASQL